MPRRRRPGRWATRSSDCNEVWPRWWSGAGGRRPRPRPRPSPTREVNMFSLPIILVGDDERVLLYVRNELQAFVLNAEAHFRGAGDLLARRDALRGVTRLFI